VVDILARNVDAATIRRLHAKAAAKGVSFNDIAREALISYVKQSTDKPGAEADRTRETIGKVSGGSAANNVANSDNDEHRS
jgi:plasmid stability protein